MKVTALLTPALYGEAAKRDIDLSKGMQAKDTATLTRAYAQAAYFACVNEWEVRRVDEPSIGDFPHTFAEFDDWAWTDGKGLAQFIDALLLAFTGKTLKDYAKEAESEGLKKKMKK